MRNCVPATILLAAWSAVLSAQGPPDESRIRTARTISKAQLLKRVDRTALVERHHIDVDALATVRLGVFLSIDEINPAAPIEGNELQVHYTVTNFTQSSARGTVTGRYDSAELVSATNTAPLPLDLPPGASVSSVLHLRTPLTRGSGVLRLSYDDQVTCHEVPNPRSGRPVTTCLAAVHTDASTAVAVSQDPNTVDSDFDGAPDVVEAELLARFRPYYRFSLHNGDDDSDRPADPLWFVQHSELVDEHTETPDDDDRVFSQAELAEQPELILTANTIGLSRVDLRRETMGYYLNLFNEYRSGEADWTRIRNEAIGLFGHVKPLYENPPGNAAGSVAENPISGYKIEYWQFYAFNPVPGEIECHGGSNAHEGDWEGVELVVQDDKQTIRYVRYHVHSTSLYFELPPKVTGPAGSTQEIQGSNAGSIPMNVWLSDVLGSNRMNNNLLRLYCSAQACTHPVVYIEHGGHASWPTQHWSWPVVRNHDGNSAHQYLVAVPPNLGEVKAPNRSCPACELVLRFNGHWGACGKDPPNGPPLKWSFGNP